MSSGKFFIKIEYYEIVALFFFKKFTFTLWYTEKVIESNIKVITEKQFSNY